MSDIRPLSSDIWSDWLLKRRFGGDPDGAKRLQDYLGPIRDRVLTNAALKDGDTLLDVGCGDGLIAFGALQAYQGVSVIFSDISATLLAHVRQLAADAQILDRCQFVEAAADNLAPIGDATVDAVTTRSVLIYVGAKETAVREFYRVLKSGGRLSIFEPINSFRYEQPEHEYFGLDVTPVVQAANKLKAYQRSLQPPETDPMLNFDERDLLRSVEAARFQPIQMEYHVALRRWQEIEWSVLINQAPNPKLVSWSEMMDKVLTAGEKEAFIAHVRPQIENRQGRDALASAYVWATKS